MFSNFKGPSHQINLPENCISGAALLRIYDARYFKKF